MVNEEELFDVQDQYDLITLGWIHVKRERESGEGGVAVMGIEMPRG